MDEYDVVTAVGDEAVEMSLQPLQERITSDWFPTKSTSSPIPKVDWSSNIGILGLNSGIALLIKGSDHD